MIGQILHMKIFLFSLVIVLTGCLARPIVKKPDSEQHLIQNQQIEDAIIEKAKTGDWLVIRGYHAVDNLVSNATGIPISHVGVFDYESFQVIEAEGKGVHTTALTEFVDKSYRLLIIRPRWRTEDNACLAYENAANLVGKIMISWVLSVLIIRASIIAASWLLQYTNSGLPKKKNSQK